MLPAATYSRYRFAIGAISLWAHFVTGATLPAVFPILPVISDHYGVSNATASLLVSAWTIAFAVGCLPSGIMVGRVGVWRTIMASQILISTMTLSMLAPGFEILLLIRLATGLGTAMMVPATGPLLMQWFKPKEMPIMTSLNMSFASLGLVVSTSTAAPLASWLGWENMLGFFGALAIVGAVLWLVWGKTRDFGESEGPRPRLWGEVFAILRNRTVLLLGLADAICFSLFFALSSWLPTFYHETRGTSLTEAGFVTGQMHLTGIFGILLGGVLAMKVRPRRNIFIVAGAIVGITGLGSFLVDNKAINYTSILILGGAAWLYTPVLLTLPMELPGITQHRLAIAWGSIITIEMIGVSISPLVVGAMADAWGSFLPGFLLFSGTVWLVCVVGFMLPEPAAQTGISEGPAAPSPTVSGASGQ